MALSDFWLFKGSHGMFRIGNCLGLGVLTQAAKAALGALFGDHDFLKVCFLKLYLNHCNVTLKYC